MGRWGTRLAAAAVVTGGVVVAVLTATGAPGQATTTGQPHEARIVLATGQPTSADWQPVGPVYMSAAGVELADGTMFDPRAYPAGAAVRLRYVAGVARGDSGGCVRLYDSSTQQPVPGTHTCPSDASDAPYPWRYTGFTSAALHLPTANHLYTVQVKQGGQGPMVAHAELVISWTG